MENTFFFNIPCILYVGEAAGDRAAPAEECLQQGQPRVPQPAGDSQAR